MTGMKWWHWHSDPNWQLKGIYRLYQCRCGHRRIQLAYVGIISPEPYGWPRLVDRHGQHMMTSGWVAPPQGGWPERRDEPRMAPPRRR